MSEIMLELAGALAIVVFLATVAQGLVEKLIRPLWERYGLGVFWLAYITGGLAFGLTMVSGINLFANFLPADTAAFIWFGRVMTAFVAACGADFVRDIFATQRLKVASLQRLQRLTSGRGL